MSDVLRCFFESVTKSRCDGCSAHDADGALVDVNAAEPGVVELEVLELVLDKTTLGIFVALGAVLPVSTSA